MCERALPWLYGIASNLARHHHRSERRRLTAYARASASAPASAAVDLDGRLEATALRPVLAAALRSLSEDDRDAILLYAWAELAYDEVAQALDVPLGTVKSRISRARERLREQLRASGQLEGEGTAKARHE